MATQTQSSELTVYEATLSLVRVMFWPVVWAVLLCWLFVPLLFPLFAYLRYKTTRISVTSRRVILKHGIIASSTQEVRLDKVETVSVVKGLTDRITGSGTVMVVGSGGSSIALARVADAEGLRAQVSECIEMNSRK